MMLAGYTLGLGALGFAADWLIGWGVPWLGIGGVLIGFAAGFYRLIRMISN